MRRWLEGLETFAIDVILERRYGRRADILRWFLLGLSQIYLVIVQTRLALYRHRFFRQRTLGCLVISVGNLTVGGTGKTPVVEMLARALTAGGRKVAILSRSADKIAAAAKTFRVYYAKAQSKAASDYLMDHSSFVYLVGPDGGFRALFRQGVGPQELADAIRTRIGG